MLCFDRAPQIRWDFREANDRLSTLISRRVLLPRLLSGMISNAHKKKVLLFIKKFYVLLYKRNLIKTWLCLELKIIINAKFRVELIIACSENVKFYQFLLLYCFMLRLHKLLDLFHHLFEFFKFVVEDLNKNRMLRKNKNNKIKLN